MGLPLEQTRRLLLPHFPAAGPAPAQPQFPDPTRYGRTQEMFGNQSGPASA